MDTLLGAADVAGCLAERDTDARAVSVGPRSNDRLPGVGRDRSGRTCGDDEPRSVMSAVHSTGWLFYAIVHHRIPARNYWSPRVRATSPRLVAGHPAAQIGGCNKLRSFGALGSRISVRTDSRQHRYLPVRSPSATACSTSSASTGPDGGDTLMPTRTNIRPCLREHSTGPTSRCFGRPTSGE